MEHLLRTETDLQLVWGIWLWGIKQADVDPRPNHSLLN